MEYFHSGRDFFQPLVDAINEVLDNKTDDPKEMKKAHQMARAGFVQYKNILPYSMYNIGRILVSHAIKEVEEDTEYQKLFRQYAEDPYKLAKILVKKDPDRFFDYILVAWVLRKTLPEYVQIDEDSPPPAILGGGGGGGFDDDIDNAPRLPSTEMLDRIRDNIEFLDEEDIYEMTIHFFKQQDITDEGGYKDGFERGFEVLLRLLDGVDDPEHIAKIERVFDKFQSFINMKFGQFKPHLKRKNFPYITVRSAISEMKEMDESNDNPRRFAHFDTRTGKTSLALLEAEYLGKKRVLYICPPDTIPTIVKEYKSYGGDMNMIHVARYNSDIEDFNSDLKDGYLIIPSSLVSGIDASSGGEYDRDEDVEDVEELQADIEQGPSTDNRNGIDIKDFRDLVNPSVLELFESWNPDYTAIDEARYFTGYNCHSNEKGSKRSRALLYLLNNETALDRKTVVRLMDATPGDISRHFYPLLSILDPAKFPMPEDAQKAFGNQPYLLSSAFAERVDHATHNQVYNRPLIHVVPEDQSVVEMGAAQNAIYNYASRYSTSSVLHRITLARIATFNPVVLKPAFRRLLTRDQMSQEELKSKFDDLFNKWKNSSQDGDISFNWDYVARFGDQKLLMHLFSFNPELFYDYYHDEPEKLDVLRKLYDSNENLSCKSERVIDDLNKIVEKAERGERHIDRIIIYSTFKKGLTRGIGSNGDDEISLRLEEALYEQITNTVPGVNVYMLDGGVSTKSRKDGLSARDSVRKSWRDNEGINVLLAVGPATCQGIDLTARGHRIKETYMDIPLDGRLDYQIQSRTLGPSQDRSVTKQTLYAVIPNDGGNTIDTGIRDLITSKHIFRDLVCMGVSVPNTFVESIEAQKTVLGGFCEAEKSEKEVAENIRNGIKNGLKPE